MPADVTHVSAHSDQPRHVSQLVSVQEVCQLLGLEVWAVRDYARHGVIPAYKVGRGYRFDPVEVQEWLRSRRVHPAAEPAKVLPEREQLHAIK